MTQGRVEPYQRALTDLRERIRVGALPPGSRITAKDVADDLGLSPTPVREAMARMAGEGILEERRGDGFFVRTLTVADVEGLYRLSLAMLREALAPVRRPRPDLVTVLMEQSRADPVRAVERLFLAWVAEAQSAVVVEKFQLLICQLGPVRRVEPLLLGDLASEAMDLVTLAIGNGMERMAAVEQFHERRLSEVDALAAAAHPQAG
jgi:DNA-binding transcriptional regulator YhcF (GntR family)